jgi:hypothetical protein
MIVDPSPVIFQEKEKFQADDPPPEQYGTGTTEEQQNDESWQTVTRKKKKSSKKNKTQRQEVLKVMTDHKPTSHQKVHKIMVCDVPSTWRPEKIMNKLTLWGKTLSISIKTQKKYHSLHVRIELNSFKAATFDRKDWTTDLGGIPVRWFPASWMLKKRKERERFQAAIMDVPESMTLETLWQGQKPTQFLAQMTGQAFKLVNTGKGKRKLIVYCKNWQPLHTLFSL